MSAISRDQGLTRISRLTRWVAAGGLACAGLFAAIVAKAQPGRASVNTPTVSGSASSGSSVDPSADPAGQVSAGQDDSGLQSPYQAPAQVPLSRRQQAVVSGGS